ncbi:MAG TPA: thiamine pyrophosphate-dependent enzyme [Phycisphaerae bacterium]|nr:thiamine pyrophosphate-dependent enzyme [Phycisphaerae bacterium]
MPGGAAWASSSFTYCVGGLNVLNAIAGAYAEKSPVVVISGAPGRKDREKDPLLHHKVKTFETQRRVYDEVTVASTVLLDEQTAASEIIRVVEAAIHHKRPVYIEVPYDIVDKPIPIPALQHSDFSIQHSDEATLAAALEETRTVLACAKQPVILAGVELHRHNLIEPVLKFAESLNIPIAADLLSKSVIAESHPLYLGVYGGAMSSSLPCRDYVESADCVLMLGTFITDMSMGIYTAKLERTRVILATTEQLRIHYHTYEDVQLPDYLAGLQNLAAQNQIENRKSKIENPLPPFPFTHPNPHEEPRPLAHSELTNPLTMASLLHILSLHLDENCCVISDVGDALFGAVGIRTARRAEFIAPAYYLSMGFAVPASIGVSMAAPNLRPVVLVGDGAFQMTGTELSTAVRLGLKPIIIILNNDGFGTMRKIRDGSFNTTSRWNYGKICELIGGGNYVTAETKGQFDGALQSAMGSNTLTVIDARLPRDDMSPQLKNMTLEMAKLRRATT